MKRAILILTAVFAVLLPLRAQEEEKKSTIDLDKEFFHLPDSVTDEYLDNAKLTQKVRINDYWIVGAHGGVSLEYGYFNPTRHVQFYLNKPVYGFSITRYATMMNTFPNLGMELGFQHNYEGYNFKEYEMDGHIYRSDIDGAYQAYMEVPEVFLLTHGHVDAGNHFKILAKLGMYGGYRMNITRIGEYVREDIVNVFKDTDRRWTYGVQGGLGFGLMFDPFEFHLCAQVKWGWNSFYEPDVASPYYYRFAYPLDGAVTFGVYYQLSPRRGHTRAGLRKLARRVVAEERENSQQ